jgi:hypothetical protein
MRLTGIWKLVAVVALVAVFGPSILQRLDLGELGDAIRPAPTGRPHVAVEEDHTSLIF